MKKNQSRTEPNRMTIWEHIGELRNRLIKCVIAIALGSAVIWIFYSQILDFLLVPYREINPDINLIVTSPLEAFSTRLRIATYGGIGVAMPVLLWQLWQFVVPALYPKEKKYATPFLLTSLLLFVLGASLAYLTLNPALDFLIKVGGTSVTEFYTINTYISLVVYMMLAFGVGFEFPVILVAAQLIGMVEPKRLLTWWRPAIVAIVALAAIITPSADPISLLALAIPMSFLYFGAIGVGAILCSRRNKHRAT